MSSGGEATGEVRWSSCWAAGTHFANLLIAKDPPVGVLQQLGNQRLEAPVAEPATRGQRARRGARCDVRRRG